MLDAFIQCLSVSSVIVNRFEAQYWKLCIRWCRYGPFQGHIVMSPCQYKQDKKRLKWHPELQEKKRKSSRYSVLLSSSHPLNKAGIFWVAHIVPNPQLHTSLERIALLLLQLSHFMQYCWLAAVRESKELHLFFKHTFYYFWQIESFVCLEHFQAFNGLEALWHDRRGIEPSVAERWWCQRLALPPKSAEMHPGGPFMPDWHRYPSSGLSDFKWQCCECPTAVHYVKKMAIGSHSEINAGEAQEPLTFKTGKL